MKARLLLPLALLLSACAAPDRIVLLPDDQGRVGRLNVGVAGGDILLDSAYATASASSGRKAEAGHTDAQAVNQEFGAVLAVLPPAPYSNMLYFKNDTDDLTDESRDYARNQLRQKIAGFPAPEIVLIGHTDTVGGDDFNDRLSLERAKVVKQLLIGLGFEAAHISVAGRGKRELLVPTADGVAEPRNRRVEILVR